MGKRVKVMRDCPLRNKLGMHARPASMIAQIANRFQSDISITKDGQDTDGKSVMGLLMLAAEQGSVLSITAHGEDALEALDAIEKLIAGKFGED